MPKDIQTDREAMTDGVIAVIEKSGYGAVTARSVAAELGISTQPIYREFGDMEGIKRAALNRGWQIYAQYVTGEATEQAVKYVFFAIEHKNLFNFLFRGRNVRYDGLTDMSHKLVSEDIIDKLVGITGLDRERVYRLHLTVWMALHGLADIVADNDVALGEDEVKQFTRDITQAMSAYMRTCGG